MAKILITIEGGIVQDIHSDVEVEVTVVERDKDADERVSITEWNSDSQSERVLQRSVRSLRGESQELPGQGE